MRFFSTGFVAGCVVCVLAVQSAAAGPMFTPLAENVEVMAESLGSNITMVPRAFGADPNANLSFTTQTDLAGQSFSYLLDSGTSYGGLGMTLNGTGTFNVGTGLWDLTSAGTLGSVSWTGVGTAEVIGDPIIVQSWVWTIVFPPGIFPIPLLLDEISTTVYVSPVPFTFLSAGAHDYTVFGVTVASGTHVDAGVGIPGTDFSKEWRLNTSLGFGVNLAGQVPEAGGEGAFAAQVVPEPGALPLCVIGVVGIWVYHRRAKCRIAYGHC